MSAAEAAGNEKMEKKIGKCAVFVTAAATVAAAIAVAFHKRNKCEKSTGVKEETPTEQDDEAQNAGDQSVCADGDADVNGHTIPID